MLSKKQVEKNHYRFSKYMEKPRWSSLWHQLSEVSKLSPENVLEIGPGIGFFKNNAKLLNIEVETLDIDPELNPDHLSSATDMPFKDRSYSIVCAFQMLEHLPFDKSLLVFSEMCRVSEKFIIISLPDAKTIYPLSFSIPKIGLKCLHIPRPFFKPKEHIFDGEHYWELNKKGYDLKSIILKMKKSGNVTLEKTYRVNDNTYHRFFVFRKSV